MQLSRNALKSLFRAGQMPCEEDFNDLIDSSVNIEEDGFEKTPENGLKISQLTDSGKLMSFYENVTEGTPLWQVELRKNGAEEDASSLHVSTPSQESSNSVVSLVGSSSVTAVGIGTRTPECTLDVNGVISSEGRIGKENDKLKVEADGRWHDITEELNGCEAFEIIAGVGGQENEGRFALTHAIAMNVFHGKPAINKTQSYYGGRGSRIDVRWARGEERYTFKLQLRTHCAYKNGSLIRYRLTKLWFDNMMVQSLG